MIKKLASTPAILNICVIFLDPSFGPTYEIVGDGPHPLVAHDDPDDDEIPARRHRGHEDEEQGPQDLAPQGQEVRVLWKIKKKKRKMETNGLAPDQH